MLTLTTIYLDSFVASACYFIILKLLVRQMEMSRTPSAVAKISRWTFASQAIADAYSFVGVRSYDHLSSATANIFGHSTLQWA